MMEGSCGSEPWAAALAPSGDASAFPHAAKKASVGSERSRLMVSFLGEREGCPEDKLKRGRTPRRRARIPRTLAPRSHMEWEIIGPVIIAVTFILTVGGVLVLRPIAKRLTDLLELYSRDRQAGIQSDVHQVRDLLETMNARLQLLEDRQDFTERLLTRGESEPEKRPELPRSS
jgi:hypothetical protein